MVCIERPFSEIWMESWGSSISLLSYSRCHTLYNYPLPYIQRFNWIINSVKN